VSGRRLTYRHPEFLSFACGRTIESKLTDFLAANTVYRITQRIDSAREDETTPVLVVGGSLVGLSAALFLAWRGVPTVLIDRYPGSSVHPRAMGFMTRTMELYRAVGLGSRIPQIPPGYELRRARVESLGGQWFEESPWTPPDAVTAPEVEYSPCTAAAIAQDQLEPILRARAVELGADVRLSTQFVDFDQDSDGVTVSLREAAGRDYRVRASYVIAADGSHSPTRESLGIGRDGRGHIITMRSVLFSAPLDQYLEKGISQFDIDQPDLRGMLTTYRDGRWLLMVADDVERGENEQRALVAKAIGRSDLDIELITTGRWELSALIADHFSEGRIFLVGDAAHTLPPNRGGYGANTGIEDVHNLAWKLASVLKGDSTQRLLDTYDAERRPIAWLRHQQIFVRQDYMGEAGSVDTDVPIIEDEAMELGQLYRSTAVLGARDELPPAMRTDEWAGQPGTRAPHAWVTVGERTESTLDLLQKEWVVFAGDDRWGQAVSRASKRLGLAVKLILIGVDVIPHDDSFLEASLGLKSTGATLIRPDGYIAWRSVEWPDQGVEALSEALRTVAAATRPQV
jgi:putative polyketide hydroxylase